MARRPRYDHDQILILASFGFTARDIAERISCQPQTVRDVCKRHGVALSKELGRAHRAQTTPKQSPGEPA